jgi:hypothetical protein
MHKDQLQLLTDYWQLVRMTKARRFTQKQTFRIHRGFELNLQWVCSKPCTRVVALVIDE